MKYICCYKPVLHRRVKASPVNKLSKHGLFGRVQAWFYNKEIYTPKRSQTFNRIIIPKHFLSLSSQDGQAFAKTESMITISVPTHTFLKKFLLHRSNSRDGLIIISTLNSYGIHLLKVLQKKAAWEPKESIKDFKDEINFKLSEYFYTREGFYISKQNIIFFNQIIKSEFDDHIYDMVTLNISRKNKTTIEREILAALKYYDISETERSMESMLKAYQRWRNIRNYKIIRY